MPQSDDNPFKVIERGLWTLLEANAQFADLVKLQNRIKYSVTAQPNPGADARLDSELPEVSLRPNGCKWSNRGSNSTVIDQTFAIDVLTGDKRTTWYYSDVKWALIQVVVKSLRTLPSWSMPTGCTLLKVWYDGSTDELEAGEGIRDGWTMLMNITVSFHMNETTAAP